MLGSLKNDQFMLISEAGKKFEIISKAGEVVKQLVNSYNYRLLPAWESSWGKLPFKDIDGNFLFSKLQLAILLFFDKFDGGIIP